MADQGKLSDLLGRDFGAEVTLTGERSYRIDTADGSAVAITIGGGGVPVRALLAIVEHDVLSRVATPFTKRSDVDLLSHARDVSDRYAPAMTIAARAEVVVKAAQALPDADKAAITSLLDQIAAIAREIHQHAFAAENASVALTGQAEELSREADDILMALKRAAGAAAE